MSKRVIMTDTGCAPTEELRKKYDLEVMGMKITLDGKVYTDGEDMNMEQYYSMIDKVKDFTTNPPLVFEIKKKYQAMKSKGFNEIIGIHVSSKMSKLIGICNNAKNMVPGMNIKIIDTEDVSIGAYFVVEKVLELLEYGKTYEEIEPLLPEIRKSSYIQVSLSSLKYLVKNKRLGRTEGLVGSLLKVKPILGIDNEGYLIPLSKEREKEKVIQNISENAVQFLEKRPYNVKVYLTYGLDKNKRQVDQVFNLFKEKYEKITKTNFKLISNRLMPTVANLSGPETYGIAVYGEEKPIE